MDVSVTHKTQNNSRAIIILEKAFGGAGSEHLQAFRAIEKLSVVDYRQGTIELLGAVQGLADPGLVIDSISHKSFALVESRLSVWSISATHLQATTQDERSLKFLEECLCDLLMIKKVHLGSHNGKGSANLRSIGSKQNSKIVRIAAEVDQTPIRR